MKSLGKILVVDDVAQNRLQVKVALQSLDYTVVTASSGQAALDLLDQDSEIDLVLLDVFMDDMDGFETLQQMRSQPKTEGVKVIMLTGSNELEDITRAFELGAQDYISRPYRLLELKSRVETHLRLKQREEKLKDQEAILRQSEERFRMVSQLTADFAYMAEFDGYTPRLLWVFGDFERISGRPFRDYLYPLVLNYVHPDDRSIYEAYFSNVVARGKKGQVECRIRHADGSYRWLRNEIFPIEKEDPSQTTHLLGVIKDVTGQKAAEAELAANNRFLKKLFITAPMRISVYDLTNNTIEFTNQPENSYLPNTTIDAYNRLSPREKFIMFAHPDDRNVWHQILDISTRLSDDAPASVEFRRMNEDGRYHWHRTYMAAFDRNDEQFINKLLMVNMDITAEKEAKLALQKAHDELESRVLERTLELEKANAELEREIEQRRAANAYLSAIINNNLQAFLLLDPQRKVLTYNHVFETIIQRVLFKQVEGVNSIYELIPEAGLAFFEKNFIQALNGKEINDKEVPLTSQSGVPAWYRICFTPSLSDENEVMGVCIAVLDVSKQKKAELDLEKERLLLQQRVLESTTKLQEANADLLRANHAKDEFLASMSHELRTPLNDIITSTDALQGAVYGLLNDQQLRILAGIKESGQDLQMLITDILDVARAEVGKMKLDISQVRLDTVVNNSVRLVQDQAHQKNIQIEVLLDQQAIYLLADPMRLKQMLSNLLVNAIKFTPNGGRVGVEVNGDVAGGKINLMVWDTGPGISWEFIPRMFKPFEQADPKGQRYTGSGLGLYLVQKMADMHGGGVQVESEPGKGSRFTISLPWKEMNNVRPVSLEIEDSGLADRPVFNTHPVILVAEDNEIALSVMADALKARGCQVLEARNGKEVLDQMEGPMVNMILMDIQMPEMDGLEAIRFLRSRGFTHTPIFALTAAALPGDRERCLAAGANEYFSKPVDMALLMRTMKARLD
jgi:PAS domain S-box-containing protein